MSNPIVEDWSIREKYEFASQVLQRTANFINSLELQVTEHYNEIETHLEFLTRKITFLESQAKVDSLGEIPSGPVVNKTYPTAAALKKPDFGQVPTAFSIPTPNQDFGSIPGPPSFSSFGGPQAPPPSFGNFSAPAPTGFENNFGAPPSFDNFGGPPAPPSFDSFGGPPAPPSFDNFGGPPAPPSFDNFGSPPAFGNPPSFGNMPPPPAFGGPPPPPPPF